MTFFLTGGYSRDGGGEAHGIGLVGDDGFLGTVAQAESPSWVVRAGDRLYAVGESSGSVHSWRVEGRMLERDEQVLAGGEIPCHLSLVDDALLVACYGNGVLTRVPLDAEGAVSGDGEVLLRGDGSGPHPDQAGSRIHASVVRADGTVLAADLGADAVHVLRADGSGGVGGTDRWALPAGTGPRDLVPVGDRTLVLGELSCTLLVLGPDGGVEQEVRLPGAEEGDHAAALALGETGDRIRVYSGIRGSNRVAALDLSRDGRLTPVASAPTGGEWPRHLVVDGDVVRIANQLSSTVTVLDAETLEPVAAPIAVPSPTQLVPVPDAWVTLVE